MNNRKNLISALLLQMITIIQGLVLPRIIIATFGSEVNGMITSITQFLSFISLLEGGLGAVVLAELYKPIEDRDERRIIDILTVCQHFFCGLAIVFSVYTIILALIYPYLADTRFEFGYTCTLVLILSVSILAQYLFSITNKLFLQAKQKVYIINIVSTVSILLNLVLSIIVIYFVPQIHLVKLISSCIFLIQPIVISFFIEKKYKHRNYKLVEKREDVLKSRWSGFAQNLAHFINVNTDVALITLFMNLREVSVYSVYVLVISALKQVISRICDSYQSALGKYYAEGEQKLLSDKFVDFANKIKNISLVLLMTCLLLINPFVKLYTVDVRDANYFQPEFALVMVLANVVACIREPYRLLILAAGKFKETNFGAIVEAIINIGISIVLIKPLGLLGVAIGTFCAITYRFSYFIWYLHSDILKMSYKKYVLSLLGLFIMVIVNVHLYFEWNIEIDSYLSFIVYGIEIVFFESIMIIGIESLGKLFNIMIIRRKGIE